MDKIPRKSVLSICLAVGLLCSVHQEAAAQQFAVRTNALFWAASTPDIGFELVTGEHTSLCLSVSGHYKPYGINSRLALLQPEFRYWFNGRPLTRTFVGVTAFAATYDMTFSRHTYDGEAVAAGITAGYAFALGKRWNLELSGGFGLLVFSQKQLYSHDNYDDYFIDEAVKSNSWGYKPFPVRLGVTFSYIIK